MHGHIAFELGRILAALALARSAVAADEEPPNVKYLFPTGGETFYYQDVINITYESPFASPQLWTFCNSGKNVAFKRHDSGLASYNGYYLLKLDFTDDSNACYLNLRRDDKSNYGTNGDYWTLLPEARSTPKTLGLQPTAASSATQAATRPSNTGATATGSSDPDATPSSNLGAGVKAAIGTTTAIGVLGLAALVVALVVLNRRRAGASAQEPPRDAHGPDGTYFDMAGAGSRTHEPPPYYGTPGVPTYSVHPQPYPAHPVTYSVSQEMYPGVLPPAVYSPPGELQGYRDPVTAELNCPQSVEHLKSHEMYA